MWLHVNTDHHVMALIDKGYSHLHHLAFDVVDIGQMRVALDHLGRHGRWLGWGPARHGVGGNIASGLRANRGGGVLRRALLRHGAAAGRPRTAPLAGQPVLFKHVGAFAPEILLPLSTPRPSPPSARAWRCSESRSPRRSTHEVARLLYPPYQHRAGRASSRRRRGTTSGTSSSWTTGQTPTPSGPCCPRAWTRTRTPAVAPPCAPTGSLAPRVGTSSSTRYGPTTASSL